MWLETVGLLEERESDPRFGAFSEQLNATLTF
jgi:hypothetical protein